MTGHRTIITFLERGAAEMQRSARAVVVGSLSDKLGIAIHQFANDER